MDAEPRTKAPMTSHGRTECPNGHLRFQCRCISECTTVNVTGGPCRECDEPPATVTPPTLSRDCEDYWERRGCTCCGEAVYCMKCGYHQDGPEAYAQLKGATAEPGSDNLPDPEKGTPEPITVPLCLQCSGCGHWHNEGSCADSMDPGCMCPVLWDDLLVEYLAASQYARRLKPQAPQVSALITHYGTARPQPDTFYLSPASPEELVKGLAEYLGVTIAVTHGVTPVLPRSAKEHDQALRWMQ